MKYLERFGEIQGFQFEEHITKMRKSLEELETAKKLFEEKFPESRFSNLVFRFELMGNILRKPRLEVCINVNGDDAQIYFTYNFDNKRKKSLQLKRMCFVSNRNVGKLQKDPRGRYLYNYMTTFENKEVDFEFIQDYFEIVVPEFNKNPSVDLAVKLLEQTVAKMDLRKDF
jgi:hypothetical protein